MFAQHKKPLYSLQIPPIKPLEGGDAHAAAEYAVDAR